MRWQRRVCAIFHLGRKSCVQCLTFVFGLSHVWVGVGVGVNAHFACCGRAHSHTRLSLSLSVCVNLCCSRCCLQFCCHWQAAAFSFNLWRILLAAFCALPLLSAVFRLAGSYSSMAMSERAVPQCLKCRAMTAQLICYLALAPPIAYPFHLSFLPSYWCALPAIKDARSYHSSGWPKSSYRRNALSFRSTSTEPPSAIAIAISIAMAFVTLHVANIVIIAPNNFWWL